MLQNNQVAGAIDCQSPRSWIPTYAVVVVGPQSRLSLSLSLLLLLKKRCSSINHLKKKKKTMLPPTMTMGMGANGVLQKEKGVFVLFVFLFAITQHICYLYLLIMLCISHWAFSPNLGISERYERCSTPQRLPSGSYATHMP